MPSAATTSARWRQAAYYVRLARQAKGSATPAEIAEQLNAFSR